MALSVLDRPIPGQSLTDEPKNYPWERPPEMSDPDEALSFYIDKLEDVDVLDPIMEVLGDSKIPLTTLVSGLVRSLGVSTGRHSIDVGLMISPAIHEYIKRVADILEVDYDEGLPKKGTSEAVEREKASAKALTMLSDAGVKLPPVSTKVNTLPEESSSEEPELKIEDAMAKEEPAGLMARRPV
jgi:hypothetical protein|tara:strand:+ start:198 stop:749 length:552 start_codon:yes stop_codon:yes gene_type:complete